MACAGIFQEGRGREDWCSGVRGLTKHHLVEEHFRKNSMVIVTNEKVAPELCLFHLRFRWRVIGKVGHVSQLVKSLVTGTFIKFKFTIRFLPITSKIWSFSFLSIFLILGRREAYFRLLERRRQKNWDLELVWVTPSKHTDTTLPHHERNNSQRRIM